MRNDEIAILKKEIIELFYNKDLKRFGSKAKRKELKKIFYSTIIKYDLSEKEKYKIYKYIALTNLPYIISMYKNNQITENIIIRLLDDFPELLGGIPHRLLTTPNIYRFILTNLDKFYYDILPEPIAQITLVQQYFDQKNQIYKKDGKDSKGYDKEWLDENGKLIVYFNLLNSYKINTKEDYIKIVEKYKESGLTINKFCSVYHIDNVEGFKELLDRVKSESISEEEEITKININNSKKHIYVIYKIIEKLISGEMTFKEYIEEHFNYLHTLDKFSYLTEYSVRIELFKVLAKQLAPYILENENNLKIEQLQYFFNNDSVNYDISATKTCSEIMRFIARNSTTRLDQRTTMKLKSILNAYTPNYNRKNVASRINISGVWYDITDEVIDETIAYIKGNNIYLCMKTFDYYMKKILLGEIVYKEECKNQKEEMINAIIRAHNSLKERNMDTIDNYFSTIEEEKRMR